MNMGSIGFVGHGVNKKSRSKGNWHHHRINGNIIRGIVGGISDINGNIMGCKWGIIESKGSKGVSADGGE